MASNRAADTTGQSNIIRLPTAAPRKVKQNLGRAAMKARAALPRFPIERFEYPSVRSAIPVARELLAMRPNMTPELELMTALLNALDDDTREKIRQHLIPAVVADRRSALQAMALLKSTKLTTGGINDLYRAFDAAWRELEQ
ncbi:hypothetical protein [Novosphingobium humi]|uniref:Uncharacterized protein n=1 Tax=Novosphingobium humi TaxID=2282397 RepID=A0ABY7TTR2_9SPHN|nr:hypothetical protein [Novosphingobium humi]WCT76335.1 hypothetical protein PQ457_10265 [Novosphingobium humi]